MKHSDALLAFQEDNEKILTKAEKVSGKTLFIQIIVGEIQDLQGREGTKASREAVQSIQSAGAALNKSK